MSILVDPPFAPQVVMREPAAATSLTCSQNHSSVTSEPDKSSESYKVEVFGDGMVIKTSNKVRDENTAGHSGGSLVG